MKANLILKVLLLVVVAALLVAAVPGGVNSKWPDISVPGDPNPLFGPCGPGGLGHGFALVINAIPRDRGTMVPWMFPCAPGKDGHSLPGFVMEWDGSGQGG